MSRENVKLNVEEAKKEEQYELLFPERKGKLVEPSLFDRIFFGHRSAKVEKEFCERRIEACIERYPLIKLMIEALEKRGCSIDYRRHFSCEYCGPLVGGGFDPELNQIVICYNKLRSVERIESTLTHELVHMYDYCRVEFDCNSLEHVACSEIRAANLAHCSLLDSFYQRTSTPTRIAKTQQECVRTRAANSIQASRPDLTRNDIMSVVDKVFSRCFNDLEPIGRRCRLSKKQRTLAYEERKYYDFE